MNFVKTNLEVSFPVSNREIFFGIENSYNSPEIDAINYIILVAKAYTWNEKRLGRPCNMHDYIKYLHEQILVETSTTIYKKKSFLSLLCEQLMLSAAL